MRALLLAVIVIGTAQLAAGPKPAKEPAKTLAEMLGFSATDRILIINADDAGMSHSTNQGVVKAMTEGLVSSATIMVPCPWATEIAQIARDNPKLDFGVHLTHTSEWKRYRWAPLTDAAKAPGLRTAAGFMHPDVKDLYQHSTPDEAYLEARAQIRKALDNGIKVTHIDSHMGGMMYDMKYAMKYIQLAKEFNLPLRIPSLATLKKHQAEQLIPALDQMGLVYPDYLITGEDLPKGKNTKDRWLKLLKILKPGVTEIYIHPAIATPELQAITNSWRTRAEELRLFTEDEDVRQALKTAKIKIIGYRPLLKLQRQKTRPPRKH